MYVKISVHLINDDQTSIFRYVF